MPRNRGRSGSFGDLAPNLIVNAAALPATGLLGPGSRLQISLQLGGTRAQLAAAEKIELPPGFRFTTPESAQPQVRNSMDRARSFLNIAVLATILLSAAAVALSARQYSQRLRDEVALLKVLGARRAFIRRGLVLQVLMLGLIAGGLGAAVGVGGQAVLASLAAPVLKITLPPPGLLPLPAVLGLVLLMLAGFALPPVLAAVESVPVRVFQRAADREARGVWGVAAAVIAVAALLWLQAGSLKLAGFVFGGALATAGVLALFAWLLVRGLAGIRARGGIAWRFGLGNIARRKAAAVAQIVALGIALMALLLVTVVRQDLLATWQNKLPPTTPNQFLIGILPDQIAPLQAFFAARGVPALTPQPMVRARLTGLRGTEVNAESFEDPETRRWINREFNLSWTAAFGDDNEFIEGKPWGDEARGQPWLAVDDYAVERLKLKLGDTLTLDLAGTPITLEVHAVRKIKWDSFKPNFFLVTPPGVLDAEGLNPPLQWIASFYLPREQRALLRELIREFPNVTALDLDAALNQVRGIVDRIVGALEFIFLFTLLAGLVVMMAVIEGSRADRVRETGVLRALGASRRVIRQGLIAEYAVLGGLAGAVAAFAAQALAWALAAGVLELPYGPRPLLWLTGTLAGAAIVTAAGYLSLRRVLNTSPPNRAGRSCLMTPDRDGREGRVPPDSLDAIEAEAWTYIEAGGRSFRAPFHSGTLGTIGEDGPNLRTVILRGADGPSRRIWCHTDIRSPKIVELRADDRIGWTFYDAPTRLQFRAWGRAIIHHGDDTARARWQATVLNSRRIYHAVAPPSSISPVATGGLPPELDDERWNAAYSERGEANFVALETVITRLEALYLHHAGHRRASFRYDGGGTRTAADWLIP